MRIIIPLIIALIIIVALVQPRDNSNINEPNIFDAREVQVGDIIAVHTIKEIDANSDENDLYYAMVHFEGKMIVEGQLDFFDDNDSGEGWGLGNYFTPDETSTHLIPVLNIDSNRTGFTVVDNQDGELALLKEKGKKFKVKFEVQNFELYALGKGQENKATLIRIIKAEELD